jgi:hypothetical protein
MPYFLLLMTASGNNLLRQSRKMMPIKGSNVPPVRIMKKSVK